MSKVAISIGVHPTEHQVRFGSESSHSLGDLDQLRAPRRSSPDRDRRLAALKTLRDQRDQLRIRLPIHRRRLQLRHPRSVRCLSQRRLSCSRSDFDLNDSCRHWRRSCHPQRQCAQALPCRGEDVADRHYSNTLRRYKVAWPKPKSRGTPTSRRWSARAGEPRAKFSTAKPLGSTLEPERV